MYYPANKKTYISRQVPFCEEKSVQLVRVKFFRSDFLQNPYFSGTALVNSTSTKSPTSTYIKPHKIKIVLKYYSPIVTHDKIFVYEICVL